MAHSEPLIVGFVKEQAACRGSVHRVSSGPQISDDLCPKTLGQFEDGHDLRISQKSNDHLDTSVGLGRHVGIADEDIDKRRCVSSPLIFSECNASKFESDTDPGVAFDLDQCVPFSNGSRSHGDHNEQQSGLLRKVANHIEFGGSKRRAGESVQPTFIAILRHRIAIWRARRLIDMANKCADKAIKLCPQMLREPTP